jgi:hypothetical protein
MMARENLHEAIKRLAELIKSHDERLAFEAVQFTYLYGFGKPLEGRDVAHVETMQARHQELTAVPVEQPQLEAEVAAPSVAHPLPEQPPVAPDVMPSSGGTSVGEPTGFEPPTGMPLEAPVSPVDERKTVVPTPGLRCLYRGKDGQCGAQALTTSQWCQTHRDKLFSLVVED